jgi:hypothetical protein
MKYSNQVGGQPYFDPYREIIELRDRVHHLERLLQGVGDVLGSGLGLEHRPPRTPTVPYDPHAENGLRIDQFLPEPKRRKPRNHLSAASIASRHQYEQHLFALCKRFPDGIELEQLALLANRSLKSSRFGDAIRALQRAALIQREGDRVILIRPGSS